MVGGLAHLDRRDRLGCFSSYFMRATDPTLERRHKLHMNPSPPRGAVPSTSWPLITLAGTSVLRPQKHRGSLHANRLGCLEVVKRLLCPVLGFPDWSGCFFLLCSTGGTDLSVRRVLSGGLQRAWRHG